MYLKIDEVLIVEDKSKVRQGDPVVYISNHYGAEILALDDSNDGQRYGVLYYDAGERACVVPDELP